MTFLTRFLSPASPSILKTPTDKQQDFEQNDTTIESSPAASPQTSLNSLKLPIKYYQNSYNFSYIQHQIDRVNKQLEKSTKSNLEFKNHY